MATAQQMSMMQLALEELNNQLARVAAAGISGAAADWLLTDGSADAARRTFVAEMRKALDLLDQARDRVARGEWTFEKWASLANDYRSTLASKLRESADWSLSAYLRNVGSATASDTAAAVERVAEKAELALPLLGVVVVGLIVLKVL
jgi:hypothetical protein